MRGPPDRASRRRQTPTHRGTPPTGRGLQALGADYRPSNEACYSPSRDTVYWPPKEAFKDLDHYFSTAYHETAHWTGHESRLNRKFGLFGTKDYAKEELVAELASTFLCAEHGINSIVSHNAAYLDAWLKTLKADPSFLFQAANQAQTATKYLQTLAQSPERSTQASEISKPAPPKIPSTKNQDTPPAKKPQPSLG